MAAQRKQSPAPATVKVLFTRYYHYDFGGGGMPFGHDHDDAAGLKFLKTGRVVWAPRYDKVARLENFIRKHGTRVGQRESLPSDRDYSSQSYKQEYTIPAEFKPKAVRLLISSA